MEDTSKYLIHADVTADGVVERSDVVGAIFGQTEGLLGDELDLRDLRQSQKVGRIDVEITSTKGQSHGHVTIATSLDKVETATLAASLETISRVGPCRADLDVTEIEDVRAAKRKEVVERAKELLRTGFDDSVMSSEEILAEVREHVRVEDITEYEGLPAGPRVTDSDAIIVVEGRSDVLTLLKYGIKNGIAVEGTNVPDAVAELTRHRTVTAFLDGDRGGDLILEELSQVGDVDYVAFAPAGESVEELDHHQVFAALRNKVPYDTVSGLNEPREAVAATDGSATPAPVRTGATPLETSEREEEEEEGEGATDPGRERPSVATADPESSPTVESAASASPDVTDDETTATRAESEPAESTSVYDHASAVIREGTDRVRFLDADAEIIDETDASDAFEALESTAEPPITVVLDGIVSQRLLDLAADVGVERIVARTLGQFTKRPTEPRVYEITEIAETAPVDR
ncbi:DNA primase DnaG [Natrarchaeobaculum sulfurireducens]|uniref:DNA primase DnaG n=1 Tax=Natrarchaeobaculum sulfurireducens TaxID=2044521 RepID=A0A346PU10_9EURY|nr:DNA primase DnaG [Natrarchaeobaculum sulfurireducens]AXR83005.1 DNA primase [Natrarchaeobaculum sulfurireducens]